MRRAQAISPMVSGPADALLHALPHPVIMVSPDGKIADANVAAEQFFEASTAMLRRHMLGELVPFGSPLLTLIEQVRTRGAAVNEYKVDLATPRNPVSSPIAAPPVRSLRWPRCSRTKSKTRCQESAGLPNCSSSRQVTRIDHSQN
jgi:nitrogen-specific signal transduction histidine kinase